MSAIHGHDAMNDYLASAGALPLRDYVPIVEGAEEKGLLLGSCKGRLVRSEPDDDINYTVLALKMMEEHGSGLTTEDVARTWLRLLPAAWTFTAERAAFKILFAGASVDRPPGGPCSWVRNASRLPIVA